jgi:hypothetical protein
VCVAYVYTRVHVHVHVHVYTRVRYLLRVFVVEEEMVRAAIPS